MSVGIIVLARVQSKRIYQKPLQVIRGKTTIEILLDKIYDVGPYDHKYPVILAIPDDPDNDILQTIANDKGFEVFRGFNDSPFHRLEACAVENNFDTVVRITCDDILIDKEILMNQINFHIRGDHEYTFARRCPEGAAGEVIDVPALSRAVKNVGDKNIEYISYPLKAKGFKVKEYYPHDAYKFSYRLTMDWPEDLLLLRHLFTCLRENFNILDAINYLYQHKSLLQINRLPTVTVYTCNHNTGKYIIETMSSILSQVYDDFEYIVIDDHSTDNSMNEIMEYYTKLPDHIKSKVKIFRNDKNIGLPACCNKVLDMARGKYIMRVDSDDTVTPDILEKMVNEIKRTDVQGCISGYTEIDTNDEPGKVVKENKWHPGCALLAKWAVNELRFMEDLKYLEGREFFDRFDKKYRIQFLDDSLWWYRQHPEQKTAQKDHPDNKEVGNG